MRGHQQELKMWITQFSFLAESMSSAPTSLSQICDVIGVLAHPHYTPSSLDYNVALLKLSSPLNLSESMQPIYLPSAGQEIPPSLHCWALAWTGQMCTSPVCLHELTVVIVTQ